LGDSAIQLQAVGSTETLHRRGIRAAESVADDESGGRAHDVDLEVVADLLEPQVITDYPSSGVSPRAG
jgi:hypothetical protein